MGEEVVERFFGKTDRRPQAERPLTRKQQRIYEKYLELGTGVATAKALELSNSTVYQTLKIAKLKIWTQEQRHRS